MKKTIQIITYILFFSIISFSQPIPSTSKRPNLQERIDSLDVNYKKLLLINDRVSDLNKRIEQQGNISDRTLNSISNQLSGASYNLTVFSILFSIAAVFLGLFIALTERKIVRISEENKELLKKNHQIKEEVVALNELIQKDIKGLYKKLTREETVNLLERLINVPQDIKNLEPLLLARDLLEEDFPLLLQAYKNLDNIVGGGPFKREYYLLFFQHFFSQALKNEILYRPMTEYFDTAIDSCFPNDITKVSKDFIQCIIEKGLNESQELITSYVTSISTSQYVSYENVYQMMFNSLVSKKNQFTFFTLIPNECHVVKLHFGNLLSKAFADSTLSVVEQTQLVEVNNFITNSINPSASTVDTPSNI